MQSSGGRQNKEMAPSETTKQWKSQGWTDWDAIPWMDVEEEGVGIEFF